MVNPILEILYKSSPEYLIAFEAGYECAKKEMIEKIASMKAISDCTSTVEVSNNAK